MQRPTHRRLWHVGARSRQADHGCRREGRAGLCRPIRRNRLRRRGAGADDDPRAGGDCAVRRGRRRIHLRGGGKEHRAGVCAARVRPEPAGRYPSVRLPGSQPGQGCASGRQGDQPRRRIPERPGFRGHTRQGQTGRQAGLSGAAGAGAASRQGPGPGALRRLRRVVSLRLLREVREESGRLGRMG